MVETPEFLSRAADLLGEEERMRLIDHLAYHPDAGVMIPGAGGLRKLRWGWRDVENVEAPVLYISSLT